MSKKSNFTPTEPLVPKKHNSEPAPRRARMMARILLVILAVLIVVLVAIVIKTAVTDKNPDAALATDESIASSSDSPSEVSVEQNSPPTSPETTEIKEPPHDPEDTNYDGQVDLDDLSDSAVLAYLNDYICEDESIDLDGFLLDCGYQPAGAYQEYVYIKDDLQITIQCNADRNMVNVGDAQGTSREYGRPNIGNPNNPLPFYSCHVSWTQSYGEAREIIEKPGDGYETLTSEMLAHIVRLAFR